MALSVSATTRPPCPGEEEMVRLPLSFLPLEFQRRIDAGEFLDWGAVFRGDHATAANSSELARELPTRSLLRSSPGFARQVMERDA